MVCEVCKTNQATVFLTQIIDGKMQKMNLCETCSKEKGVPDPFAFDLLAGLGVAPATEPGAAAQRCVACGFTQADFKKTGRFGCPQCYDTFAEGLSGLLKAMHRGGTAHSGKIPSRLKKSTERNARMKAIRKELDAAVTAENYETAAQLRDQLRELEQAK